MYKLNAKILNQNIFEKFGFTFSGAQMATSWVWVQVRWWKLALNTCSHQAVNTRGNALVEGHHEVIAVFTWKGGNLFNQPI